jgi:thiol-disulfide isomerase/thioredoxin
MKSFFAIAILFLSFTLASGQNEQSPIVEKEIKYKNWTYKNVRTGQDVNLRDLAAGKRLVIVVYYAPWCPNWKHDAPFLQKFYDKYRSSGLEIIAVGEYDPLPAMKTNLDALKITFPAVYESESRDAREKTLHFDYRKQTGDTRKWGSPWYIFLTPGVIEKSGDILTRKTFVINGEMIENEGEAFIRKQLGLAAVGGKSAVADNGKIEVCDPETANTSLKKP